MKVCTKCGIEKDESEFGKRKDSKNGLRSHCKKCRAKHYKEYNNRSSRKEKRLLWRREYYVKNRKKFIQLAVERETKRVKIDNEYKLKKQVRRAFRDSFRTASKHKKGSFFKYTNIAYADYITYFEQNFPVEFSQITEKGKYHIDHIIPCTAYDFNNPEEIKLCWQPENLRIISASENIVKKDKVDYKLIEKYNIWHLVPEKIKIKAS